MAECGVSQLVSVDLGTAVQFRGRASHHDVIPGRAESADPESSGDFRICIWIPGSLAKSERPGMTKLPCRPRSPSVARIVRQPCGRCRPDMFLSADRAQHAGAYLGQLAELTRFDLDRSRYRLAGDRAPDHHGAHRGTPRLMLVRDTNGTPGREPAKRDRLKTRREAVEKKFGGHAFVRNQTRDAALMGICFSRAAPPLPPE
jgi:hypothetical protein